MARVRLAPSQAQPRRCEARPAIDDPRCDRRSPLTKSLTSSNLSNCAETSSERASHEREYGKGKQKVPPGFEPGHLGSKPSILTTRSWNRACLGYRPSLVTLIGATSAPAPSRLGRADGEGQAHVVTHPAPSMRGAASDRRPSLRPHEVLRMNAPPMSCDPDGSHVRP